MNASLSVFVIFLLLFGAFVGVGYLTSHTRVLEEDLNQLQAQNGQLSADLNACSAGRAADQQQITSLQEKNNVLTGQLDQALTQAAQNGELIATLRREIANRNLALDAQQKANAQMSEELKAVTIQVAVLTAENDRLNNQVREQQATIATLSDRNGAVPPRGNRSPNLAGLAALIGSQAGLPGEWLLGIAALLTLALLTGSLSLGYLALRRPPAASSSPARAEPDVWVRMTRSDAREYARRRRRA
jgi:hypothetical protein